MGYRRNAGLLVLAAYFVVTGCGATTGSVPTAARLSVENVDGPVAHVQVNGVDAGVADCGDIIDLDLNRLSPPPWHVVVKSADGAEIGSVDLPTGTISSHLIVRTGGIALGDPNAPRGPAGQCPP